MTTYPNFDSLPKVPGQPQGSAWGLWGDDDELGTLNFLTPEVVCEAAKEIKTGIQVQLDLPLDHFDSAVSGREGFKHQIIDFHERNAGTVDDICAHDDVLTFNTQSSSQWDGLRHIGQQETGIYYKGVKHRDIDTKKHDGTLGIHKWVERGGIAGRGVLLDYASWRQETNQSVAPANTSFSITTDELDAVAKHQGVEFRDGDILIIRSGYTAWYQQATSEERQEASEKITFIGMESSMKSVKWLWNHHFSAVAGDTLGFETTPIGWNTKEAVRLHEWLLVQWATPIGELWGLERLAQVCKDQQRWSFFLTSAPLNVFGGVGSPPNAIALF